MNKTIKIGSYIIAALLISIGILYAQRKPRRAKEDINHRYLEMAKTYMESMPSMSYDYNYNLYHEGTVVDTIKGRLYKIGSNNYVDSNNYYAKVLFDDFYVLYNHKQKTAQYLNIPELEQRLGISRSEMFGEIFQLPDSSFYEIGTVTTAKTDAGMIDFTYALNDTSLQVRNIRFVIDEKGKKINEITMSFNLAQYRTIYGVDTSSGTPLVDQQESILRITNIHPYTTDATNPALKGLYFDPKTNTELVLNGKFKAYKLSKL